MNDAASAHLVTAGQGVRFRGGNGSCVIDTYVTRSGYPVAVGLLIAASRGRAPARPRTARAGLAVSRSLVVFDRTAGWP